MQTSAGYGSGEVHASGEDALFLAGHPAPAGTYCLVGTDRQIRLDAEGILPATCDGQVAVYVRRPVTWAQISTPAGRAGAATEKRETS